MSPSIVLKLLAPIFFLVGGLHLVFGVGADVMLGAVIPEAVLQDPVLDSQNRFYGTAFTLYGAVFYICSQNIGKNMLLLRCALWIFFASGLARLVSIAVTGVPSVLVLCLLATELLLPPIFLYWVTRQKN